MNKAKRGFKYIYGPVSSWRLGRSLGIDLLSAKDKVCSFDCLYCQLGRTKAYTSKRKVYVPTKKIVEEIQALPKVNIDYLTFSGRGEPTLAKNLGQVIRQVKRLRQEPVAVLTNASLLEDKRVRKELLDADLVAAKLDADSQQTFDIINRPAKKVRFFSILKGLEKFSKAYRGKLVLQIMFIKKNKGLAKNIAKLAQVIGVDEIHLCTASRPSAAKPLSLRELAQIKRHFPGIKTRSPDEVKRKRVRPLSVKDTWLRRGKAV